jgi:glycine dehydrogenase subunit 2
LSEPLTFEKSRPSRGGPRLPTTAENGDIQLPPGMERGRPPALPRLSEPEIMRHYSRLASLNYSISENFYPLGSCTMKYNPVANEQAARLPGFAEIHPYQDPDSAQGALQLMWELERALCEIAGVERVTLQPAAGAHGEWTALRMIQAYHLSRGEERSEVIVPDSAHGTNPASAALCGFRVVEVKSGRDGRVDVADLEAKLSDRVAALMLTNPNTLGLFEKQIVEVSEMVHATGAKLYYDGANLNALMGICRPGDMGFDAVHMNLHKTFTTPHGGGGPGSGPVGVKADLVPFLPRPTVERENGHFFLDHDRPHSIGRVRSFYGNFGMLVRAFTYILAMGGDGLTQASNDAVLAANYLRKRLEGVLDLPHDGPCMHEFVASARNLTPQGVRALDLAKGLLERGFYAPTIYFPLIVPEAVMIEPTETESKATLDAFADALREIVELAGSDPDELHSEPRSLPVGRLDEVRAARNPVLRWRPDERSHDGSIEPEAGVQGGAETHTSADAREAVGRRRPDLRQGGDDGSEAADGDPAGAIPQPSRTPSRT